MSPYDDDIEMAGEREERLANRVEDLEEQLVKMTDRAEEYKNLYADALSDLAKWRGLYETCKKMYDDLAEAVRKHEENLRALSFGKEQGE